MSKQPCPFFTRGWQRQRTWGNKGELAPCYRSASNSLSPAWRITFHCMDQVFCFTEDLKSKLSPGWKQDLVVVSHNLNDTDYSCFVKLYAEVITKWQTTRGYSNYPLMVLKRGSGCKLFRGDLRTASECFVWRLQPCPILHPKSITFPSWIALLGL